MKELGGHNWGGGGGGVRKSSFLLKRGNGGGGCFLERGEDRKAQRRV